MMASRSYTEEHSFFVSFTQSLLRCRHGHVMVVVSMFFIEAQRRTQTTASFSGFCDVCAVVVAMMVVLLVHPKVVAVTTEGVDAVGATAATSSTTEGVGGVAVGAATTAEGAVHKGRQNHDDSGRRDDDLK